jgi:HD superfamily phosphohydrolase/nicotinamide riboside kinase
MNERVFTVGFSGAHSTGKSTLAEYFRVNLPEARVEIVAGITRQLIAEGFPLGRQSTQAAWLRYVTRQLQAERRARLEGAYLTISDRTILDALGYARTLRGIRSEEVTEEFLALLKEVWLAEMHRYDLIVYFPIEFAMVSDGIRDEDPGFRERVDKEIRAALQECPVACVTVGGDLENRYRQVMAALAGMPSVHGRNTVSAGLRQMAGLRPLAWGNEDDELEEELMAEGFGDVLESPFLRRLRGVSFLGTLDVVYGQGKPSSRYSHSLAVGMLYLNLARRLNLPDVVKETLVIAGLLHDVGHAPFSHNSEPFIAEALKLYHQGLLSAYIHRNWEFSTERYTVRGILGRRSAEVRRLTLDLLTRSSEPDASVGDLFLGAINCDKIEGNNRSLRYLARQPFNVDEILRAFVFARGRFFVQASHLDLLEAFWHAEAKLYWEAIYTDEVFSSEAMLTRALASTFNESDRIRQFLVSTDGEVIEALERERLPSQLIEALRRGEFYSSLRKENPELWHVAEAALSRSRFDRAKRKQLESWLATELGSPSELVISHFSRRKQFLGGLRETRQRELFGDGNDLIPLEAVNRDLASTKVSGDFFDVFFPA